ncbi:ATP-binding protein [Streptomyces aurantiacus]|uniref:histidine kinase n=1 Tax=Streptomyces aurantiacus JA 4570 TaxID=1286094 RepID=S3ZKI0_9ACTN|nr:ATP-binding protein [Streptomyces aurantiacus]EPH43289.1 putative Sensor protein CutS [Streptomyces aurantiacus JA 4570]
MRGERARLTALYGVLLVLAGALLTGVVYLLVQQGLYSSISTAVTTAVPGARVDRDALSPPWATLPTAGRTAAAPARPLVLADTVPAQAVTRLSDAAGEAALSRLLTISVIVLTAYAVLSVALAWWMAGRVLRPVAVITDSARRLSGSNLHERIALDAPPGELKQLADTFDAMLDRIERLVGAQQRFAANAAHELRTPLAVQRAAAEIGLAGDPAPERVARIRAKLISVADDSERLIEGLLLLATTEQGPADAPGQEPVALDVTAREVAAALAEEAARRTVTVDVRAEPLTVHGDGVLLEHLVHNLIANAVRHNVPGGRVQVHTATTGITVVNTGPDIPPESVTHLFEPFRRLHDRTHAPGEGTGLGLSIVTAIARAHGGTTQAKANGTGGGLRVTVHFPSTGVFRGAGNCATSPHRPAGRNPPNPRSAQCR